MANPQAEHGHVDIANEIIEALARGCPGNSEGQILWAVIRKTYGWHKKEDAISISQIMAMTGLSRRMVIYSIQNLEAKRMIKVKRQVGAGKKNVVNTISFQKNYDIWLVQEKSKQYKKVIENRKLNYQKYKENGSARKVSGARNGILVVQEMENNSRFLAPTKETFTKEKTKENTLRDFSTFWDAYPRRIGKGGAQRAWKKNGRPDIETILQAIADQKAWRANAQEGEFRPEWKNPATWLNQKCWEDELPKTKTAEERRQEWLRR